MIKEKIMTYTLYVAEDGEEFETKRECREHNEKIKRIEKVKKLPHKNVSVVDRVGGGCGYYIKSKEDFELVKQHKFTDFIRNKDSVTMCMTGEREFDGEGWYVLWFTYKEVPMLKTEAILHIQKLGYFYDHTAEFFNAFDLPDTLLARYDGDTKKAYSRELEVLDRQIESVCTRIAGFIEERSLAKTEDELSASELKIFNNSCRLKADLERKFELKREISK